MNTPTDTTSEEDGFTITFAENIRPFRVKKGRLAAFIEGITFHDKEVFTSDGDARTLSKLVSAAIAGGAIDSDPRITFHVCAEDDVDESGWQIEIRRASSWKPQLSVGECNHMADITSEKDTPDQVRAAITKAVDVANKTLAELRERR